MGHKSRFGQQLEVGRGGDQIFSVMVKASAMLQLKNSAAASGVDSQIATAASEIQRLGATTTGFDFP